MFYEQDAAIQAPITVPQSSDMQNRIVFSEFPPNTVEAATLNSWSDAHKTQSESFSLTSTFQAEPLKQMSMS